MKKLLIYNAHLVDKNLDLVDSALFAEDGIITGFPTKEATAELLKDNSIFCVDAKGLTLLPGFVDMHAHFRDPGQTQKEDIESGSKAAAAGGFTTVVLMPNTNPVVSSAELAKINNNKGILFGYTQVIQSVSITKNFKGSDISHLETLDSNETPLITEDGHEVSDSAVMLEAMKIANKKNLIVSCHCEDPFLAAKAKPLRQKALALLRTNGGVPSESEKKSAYELLSKANKLLLLAEECATQRNLRLAEEAGCHIHLCHVSTARCIEEIQAAKKRGVNVTFEITPHHLGIENGDSEENLLHIVNPPLRSEADRKALVKSLLENFADVIATDHAPHTKEDKLSGSPGFSGLETAFSLCYTKLCLQEKMSLQRLSEKMSARPAELLGKNCGLLQEGFAADLILVDLEKKWTVCGENFSSKGKYSPLEGKELTGKVISTFLKGIQIL